MVAPVLEVRRDDLGTARVVDDEPGRLEDRQARFAVERFGLTANNVTYGLLGDDLRYWTFFPTPEEGWGRVPAWGFAAAVESRSPADDGTLQVHIHDTFEFDRATDALQALATERVRGKLAISVR